MLRAGRVRVGELIYEGDLRPPGDDRVGIHLFQDHAVVFDPAPGHDLESFERCLRQRPFVRFDVADHHVRPPLRSPPPLLEHRVGLPRSGSRPQIDPQAAASWRLIFWRSTTWKAVGSGYAPGNPMHSGGEERRYPG